MPVFKYLAAIALGAFVSFAGILLHNSLVPVGAIVALVITFLGIRAIGTLLHSRFAMWLSLLGWFFVLISASKSGVSFERLVVGNTTGNLYSVGSVILAVIAASIRVK